MAYGGSKAFIGSGAQLSIGPLVGSIPTGITASTTTSSTSITLSSGVGVAVGMGISGAGIPVGATLASGTGTAWVLSAAATATATGVAITLTPNYVPIMELTNQPLKPREYDKLETTNFNSTGKEYLQGMADLGTVPIEGNSRVGDPGQVALSAAWTAKGAYMFQITLPKQAGQTSVGDIATFNALVMSYTELGDFDPKKVVQIKGELQITNSYVYTVGS